MDIQVRYGKELYTAKLVGDNRATFLAGNEFLFARVNPTADVTVFEATGSVVILSSKQNLNVESCFEKAAIKLQESLYDYLHDRTSNDGVYELDLDLL